MAFSLSSPAFAGGGSVPSKYTCDGDNVSPPLDWSELPANTQALALIVDDPDAPKGTWTHWVLYNIRPNMAGLPEDFSANLSNAMQTLNSYRHAKYEGPCPPGHTQHTYRFRLYALDQFLDLPPGATLEQVSQAMEGHTLGSAALNTTYSRQQASTR